MTERLGVLGAGTMGAGIAQVAAECGIRVLLHDPVAGAYERAVERIGGFLQRRVEKGQLSTDAAFEARQRVAPARDLRELTACDFVVEAAPEDLELKRDAFRRLDAAPETTTLASNTSSLPIAHIAAACQSPGRVVGMHFFNPVPLMPLVEVVRGPLTTDATVATTVELARRLGKTPVLAADRPGFIVNRVARPFYLEALRMLGDGDAAVDEIDAAVREVGFRMGPFELIDAIGLDVNLAVSRSVYEQSFNDPRYRPHPLQATLVDAGRLGRKSGGGFYDYTDDGATPWPGLAPGNAVAPGKRLSGAEIADRIVAAVVNEAASAVGDGVAGPRDVDTAMCLGMNFPQGPLAWGERIGLGTVVERLEAMHAAAPDGRHRITPLLRELAASGGSLFEMDR